MTAPSIVFVQDASPCGDGVAAGLEATGYRVRRLDSAALLQAPDGDAADVLLLPAALWPEVSAVFAGLDGATASRPGIVLYADDGGMLTERLAPGSRADFPVVDFLLPPVVPALLKHRLDSAVEARRVVAAREDSANRELLLKLERDVQIGREIQLGFLPETLPQPEGWEITARFHPAREVAGDFYDAFYMVNERRLGFLIADVCDKGVGAALFMALFRTLVRSNAQQNISLGWMDSRAGSVTDDKDWLRGDPSERRRSLPNIGTGSLHHAMSGTNDYITSTHMAQGYFATMFFGMLDPSTGALTYINGGHNPPMIVRASGEPQFLKPTGPAVGMLPGAKFEMGNTHLDRGDILYAYTDGVTDARSPDGAFFSEQHLFDIVGRGSPSAAALVADIDSRLKTHIGTAPQFDDITMIAVRRTPDDGL